MIPNPILKVLLTLSCHEVRHLLMGGQACVFYGAAEFSRDCDIVIVADNANLARFQAAIDELDAECIAVPPFDVDYLRRGHAVHFRCRHPDAKNIRLDVMTKMRGCEDFDSLWARRTTLQEESGLNYELLGIEDLVQAKKTQRDKDWPMIRRLVEAHYDEFKDDPTENMVKFWLRESRTPAMLNRLGREHSEILQELAGKRALLKEVVKVEQDELKQLLAAEEAIERTRDQEYWRPLKAELESLRLNRTREQS